MGEKEFIKPSSLVGKEWASGKNLLETDFFKDRGGLFANYSEGEFKTLNALFYTIQTAFIVFDEKTKLYHADKTDIDSSNEWLVIKEGALRALSDTKNQNSKEIDNQDEIKEYLNTQSVSAMDFYLYQLMNRTIVATNVYDPVVGMMAKVRMFSIITGVKKFKEGKENVYHIQIGDALKLASQEYKLALTSNSPHRKAIGNYIKQTTHRKSKGKYAELMIEFLKVHQWKGTYTADLKELRHALNLPEFETTKRVTLSRVVDKINQNIELIKHSVAFSFEIHKKDEKLTFIFDKQKSLF